MFGLVGAGMVTAIVAVLIFVLSTIESVEQRAERREIRSVSRVFENSKEEILREIERFAVSNAAYENIDIRYSLDWVRQRFGVDMATDYNHDLVVLLDRDGSPVYEINNGRVHTSGRLGHLIKGDVAALVGKIRGNYLLGIEYDQGGTASFSGSLAGVSGITSADLGDGQLGLVAAYAIVPDVGGISVKAVSPYVLVAVQVLDEFHLQKLLESMALDEIFIRKEIPKGMVGVPITESNGRVLGNLVWKPTAEASRVVMSWAPLISGALLVVLVLTFYALWQNYSAALELKRREQEAILASRRDPLTGLSRRDLFYEDAERALADHENKGLHSAILYLDLDYLKQTNDAYGHVIGDRLLISVVERLQANCSEQDLLGRIGGDEFLLMMPGRASREALLEDVDRLCSNINRKVMIDDLCLDASSSVGVSLWPEHGDNLKALVRCADIALQRCKEDGRGNFRLYDVAMDEVLHEKRRIRDGLKRALDRDELVAFYQPIIETNSGKVAFAEALVRWQHPERGLLAPGAFLPVAEEDGSINAIGSWMLERAIKDAAQWPDTGVAVNVCASQLLEEGFVEHVVALLDEHGLSPQRLVLEITESVMMDRSGDIRTVFARLASLGIAIAIDDFGTGFSSLSYLHEYKFQKLKIDRSFVARIETDVDAGTIIRTMIGLAKVMGMTVVAEGVETEAQKRFLKCAQCDYLQGYYFGKPAPVDDGERKILLSA
ncbi:EAL domain-containing protein [Roseibium sp.]|uniref:bifunctional diguanylate cyclase/phosphodiesterase n=1 Tax=Roseibium sp. TaxID=1936156 RepID=UPI003A97CFEF